MEALCVHCGAKHLLNDKQIAGHAKVQFRCSKCGQPTVVNAATRPERTRSTTPLPSFARASNAPEVIAELLKEPPGLKLPADKTIALAVVAGLSHGKTHTLAKPRLVVGRQGGGADFEVDDAEVSRWHCALEVREGMVWLRDLESTNGTYYENERTRAAVLEDGTELRIGSTILRVNITPKS